MIFSLPESHIWGGWLRLLVLRKAPTRWVPRPCALRKGGYDTAKSMGGGACQWYPPLQRAQGWGTLCRADLKKPEGRATRPPYHLCELRDVAHVQKSSHKSREM